MSREYSEAALPPAGTGDAAAALLAALRCRGFLLEEAGGLAFLSDNSHPEDGDSLLEAFAAIGLHADSCDGGSVELGRAADALGRSGVTTVQAVRAILNLWPRSAREAGTSVWQRGWGGFRRRLHGPKVPVRSLEPGVAALAKAYNAAGAATWCSCSGHTPRAPARIDFSGPWFAAWARFVNEAVGVGGPAWRWRGEALLVDADHADGLLASTWAAAGLVYANRVALRDFRRRILDSIPPGGAGSPPSPADLERKLRDGAEGLVLDGA